MVIENYKSIRGASRVLKIPYTSIRRRIEKVERILGVKLLVTKRGGSDRGMSTLTAEAHRIRIIELYMKIKKLVDEYLGGKHGKIVFCR